MRGTGDMVEIDRIYNEDCLDTMSRMEDGVIDLTVTSPPYNVDLGNNKYNRFSYDVYRDAIGHSEYMRNMEAVFSMVYRKTRSGGRCCINIGDGKNGRIPTHSDYIQMMVGIGWMPMTIIIWEKNTCSARTAWGSFMSPSCPSFPRTFEYILVFAKDSLKLSGSGDTDLTRDEFVKWSLGTWTMGCENPKKVGHPAPFPVELPTRLMKMFSWVGALVYDPFGGSGTTAVAAVGHGRHFVLSELSGDYCRIAEDRLSALL